jgi:hypothetical protein
MTYEEYIASKKKTVPNRGFEPLPIIAPLFDWQTEVLQWAVRKGRAALFEDCGLGKTAQQLEWASQVHRKTGGSVIILTPLAVAAQTAREAVKFGIEASVASSSEDIDRPGIWITNYEKLEHFDCSDFAGVVLDESSILKAFTGIGSEGYGALSLGRRFVGSELKQSYAEQAIANLRNLKAQGSLF